MTASRTTTNRAKRNATTAAAKAKGQHTTIPDALTIESNGVTFAVSSTFQNSGGKAQKRSGGCAVLAYNPGSKSAVKGWTLAIMEAFAEVADELTSNVDAIDQALKIGAYKPADATTNAKAAVDTTAIAANAVEAAMAKLAEKLGLSAEDIAALAE